MRTIPSMSRRSVAALACLALSAPALAACGHSSTSADAAGTVKAVASTTQICDYITQLASGDASSDLSFDRTGADGKTQHFGADAAKAKSHLTLTCLLAPNASAHEHDMTTAQSKALSEADLFFVSGVDLEHFLDDAVASSGFHGRMVVTSGVLTASDVDNPGAADPQTPYTIDRGTERVEVSPWPFPPENAGEAPEFRFDPHVWTSPKRARVQVENLGAGLAAAAPDAAASINAATASYLEDLDALDAWATASIETVPEGQRVLFTSHDAFGYFSGDYGIRFIGAALTDFNDQQDATADHIASAVQAVKDSGAVALFAENSNNSKSIEAIARGAGVTPIVGDDALYGDSLGPDGSAGATYVGSIIHNVRAVTDAWGGTAPALPERLAGQ